MSPHPNLKPQKYYYEYIRIEFEAGNLEQLNRFSTHGWRVVCTIFEEKYYLLERCFEIIQ